MRRFYSSGLDLPEELIKQMKAKPVNFYVGFSASLFPQSVTFWFRYKSSYIHRMFTESFGRLKCFNCLFRFKSDSSNHCPRAIQRALCNLRNFQTIL